MTRILSLDNEHQMLALISLTLERVGFTCLTTDEPEQAWDLLHTASVDLLTQDLMRPKVNGWEFYRRMRADPALRSTPVVIISTKAQTECTGRESTMPGVDAYITKPFGPQKLVLTLVEVLNRRRITPPPELAAAQILPQLLQLAAFEMLLRLPNPPPGSKAQSRRLKALHTLAEVQQGEELPALTSHLRHSNSWVRVSAAYALGKLEDRETIPPLILALKDGDDKVRSAVAQTLGELEDTRAIEPLIGALDDEKANVVKAAAIALGKINHVRALPALQRVATKATWKEARGIVSYTLNHTIRILQKTQASSQEL